MDVVLASPGDLAALRRHRPITFLRILDHRSTQDPRRFNLYDSNSATWLVLVRFDSAMMVAIERLVI